MQQCEIALLNAEFKIIEIIATLAGEPLYRKFGYRTHLASSETQIMVFKTL
jgi:hypothetical protein